VTDPRSVLVLGQRQGLSLLEMQSSLPCRLLSMYILDSIEYGYVEMLCAHLMN